MTEAITPPVSISTDASVELRREGDFLYLYYCDAQVGQGEEELGDVSEYSDLRDLVVEIQESIERQAEDLAESIVKSARDKSMLAELVAGDGE